MIKVTLCAGWNNLGATVDDEVYTEKEIEAQLKNQLNNYVEIEEIEKLKV